MSEMTMAKKDMELKGPSVVLLTADLQGSIAYYRGLGFEYEDIGGHAHLTRGTVCFILHPVPNASDVRPSSTVEGGLYFDLFCYGDAVAIYEEFVAKGVEIVNGPHFGGGWNEFTMRDVNGYRIAFGGNNETEAKG